MIGKAEEEQHVENHAQRPHVGLGVDLKEFAILR